MATAKQAAPQGKELLDLVESTLDDDKGQEIVVIELKGKTQIADYMVIASGTSARHVASLAEHLREKLKGAGLKGITLEGEAQGDWVLVDAGDVVVHVFRPEVREFYKLEKLWSGDEKPSANATA